MDELSATPQAEWLQILADKLREGGKKFAKASPILGTLATKLMGNAPEGLESMSYGELPINTKANEPLWNAHTADQLDALPFVGAGAFSKALPLGMKGAMMIPIAHGVEANASKATDLARRARAAAEDLLKGAGAEDIWQTHKVAEVPIGNREPLPIEHGRFMHEIRDKSAEFSPYALGNENDKIDALLKINPKILESTNPAHQEAVQNFLKSDLPLNLPGSTLGNVLDHPELFESQPWMKDIAFKGGEHIPGLHGSYTAKLSRTQPGTIALSTLTNLQDPYSLSTPRGTTIHEIQHAVQDRYGMPGGGMSGRIVDPMIGSNANTLAETILALRKNPEPTAVRLSAELERILNKKGGAHNMYRDLLGEQQARASQNRLLLPDKILDMSPPTHIYDNLTEGLDAAVMEPLFEMVGSGAFPRVRDPGARADALVRALRGRY